MSKSKTTLSIIKVYFASSGCVAQVYGEYIYNNV